MVWNSEKDFENPEGCIKPVSLGPSHEAVFQDEFNKIKNVPKISLLFQKGLNPFSFNQKNSSQLCCGVSLVPSPCGEG